MTGGVGRRTACAFVGGALLVLSSCAQQEMPPGGPEDRRPPVVIRTDPQSLGVLENLDGAVTFAFDERISERVAGGTLATAFVVSPRGGDLRVSKGARSIQVRPEGGFRPGLVYRVTLQAVVSDLFGNQMTDPFELVFSTGGGEPVPTTLAGEVWDRVDGRSVSDAVVLAESDDGLVHQARSDRQGIYAFRYLPEGDFRVTAFEDRNRDGDVDSTEVQGVASVVLATGDTLLVDVPILEPDTSAAAVSEAEVLDSVTVVVTFDDYLLPEADPQEWEVSVVVADTTPAGVGVSPPTVARVFQEAGYTAHVQMVADSFARLDSLATAEAAASARRERAAQRAVDSTAAAQRADTTRRAPSDSARAAGDTTRAAPADTVRIGAEATAGAAAAPGQPPGGPTGQEASARIPPTELRPLQGERPGPTRDGRRVLPARRIVVVLSSPLAYDVVHAVRVDGVRNLVGLPGGGGEAEFARERPPPPDTAAVPDSGAVPDTGAVADTGAVVGDVPGNGS